MLNLPISVLNSTLKTMESIRQHRMYLHEYLEQTPKEDPFYDDFEKFLKLCEQGKNMEISVSEETASLIREINALDAQVSEKLNYLNRMAN